MEIPVYLFTGFLDSGKTTFIQSTLEDPRFNAGEPTLLLVCEEGEVEYDREKFASKNVSVVKIDDEDKLSEKYLKTVVKSTHAKKVMIEYNGMWMLSTLFQAFPSEWLLYQEMCFVNTETFQIYNANMRQFVFDKFSSPDMIVFNRYLDKYDKLLLHQAVRTCSRSAVIMYEYPNGEAVEDDIEDPLPFDKESDEFTVGDRDYAFWYRDLNEQSEDYVGKTVTVKGYVIRDGSFPEGYFAIGRNLMTCCEADIQYAGLAAYSKDAVPDNNEWILIKGKIDIRPCPVYRGKGPVFDVISYEKTEPPENQVATFF